MKIGLIPAAGRGSRMMSLTENYPKALIPYNHIPIIGRQLDYMTQVMDIIVIVVGYQKDKIINYVSNNYRGFDIRFVEQTNLDGLSSSIYKGLSVLLDDEIKDSSLTVQLSDVLVEDNVNEFDDDYILVSSVNDWSRWALALSDDNDYLVKIFDKPKSKPNTDNNLIGVYNFSDIKLLKSSIKNQIDNDLKIHNEFQLSTAIEFYNAQKRVKVLHIDSYIDLGEIDNINNISDNISRSFNNIDFVGEKALLKTSTNLSKLEDECAWYESLPEALQKYVPKIIDEKDNGYVMERITYPQLQDMMLFQHTSFNQWTIIIHEIVKYLRASQEAYKEVAYPGDIDLMNDTKIMLLNKTISRTFDLKELFPFKTYVINGQIFDNPLYHMQDIILNIKRIVATSDKKKYASILHGDLFFGNMMFDEVTSSLKLIDPRGSYGQEKLIGDIRYDIAKLNHSINGKYDFIVNDIYSLDYDYSEINYTIYEEDHSELSDIFEDTLIHNLDNINIKDINFITGILFLTMIPLHDDSYSHQVMQFAKASEFLQEFIGGNK